MCYNQIRNNRAIAPENKRGISRETSRPSVKPFWCSYTLSNTSFGKHANHSTGTSVMSVENSKVIASSPSLSQNHLQTCMWNSSFEFHVCSVIQHLHAKSAILETLLHSMLSNTSTTTIQVTPSCSHTTVPAPAQLFQSCRGCHCIYVRAIRGVAYHTMAASPGRLVPLCLSVSHINLKHCRKVACVPCCPSNTLIHCLHAHVGIHLPSSPECTHPRTCTCAPCASATSSGVAVSMHELLV